MGTAADLSVPAAVCILPTLRLPPTLEPQLRNPHGFAMRSTGRSACHCGERPRGFVPACALTFQSNRLKRREDVYETRAAAPAKRTEGSSHHGGPFQSLARRRKGKTQGITRADG